MTDFETIIRDALKEGRDNGAAMVVELFEIFASEGMCAECCLREVKAVLAKTSYKPPTEGKVLQ